MSRLDTGLDKLITEAHDHHDIMPSLNVTGFAWLVCLARLQSDVSANLIPRYENSRVSLSCFVVIGSIVRLAAFVQFDQGTFPSFDFMHYLGRHHDKRMGCFV